jgi:GDP-4-dehydro-6-deoxy-D-mannose reductase
MNVIITGGNGFLGSNITRKLLKEYHKVYIFSQNTNNIKDILPEILFDYSDTKSIVNYKDKIKIFSPDVVVHCGWSGGNSYNDINNLNQFYDNIDPSIKLLELLNQLDKKPKFIGFGSFAEYGILTTPVNEETQELPTNLYGLSKYTFKKYSEMLCNQYRMEWLWVRPCYVYGPGDVSTRLIPNIIKKFLNNEDVILDGCTSVVDYIYIDDFVNSIYLLILTKHVGVYNLCSGKQYKIRDVIEQVYNQIGSNSFVEFNNNLKRTSTYSYICGNRNKLDNAIGNLEQISLTEGLERIIINTKLNK